MRLKVSCIRGHCGRIGLAAATASFFAVPTVHALQFDFGGVTATINTTLETGLQWRMQDRDDRLVGKANLDSQLCAVSSCQGHSHEDDGIFPNLIGEGPARNQRAVEAPGQFSVNADDGNLNYDKFDLTQGLFKAKQDVTLNFELFGRDVKFFTRYYGHYDFVNYNEPIFHPNIITPEVIANNPDSQLFPDDDPPNRRTGVGAPAFVERNDRQQEQIGLSLRLLDFNFSTRLPFVGDRDLSVTVGRHLINWGESTYLAIGSLNSFSAIDANAFLRPAFLDLDEVFVPLGAVSFKTDITYDIGINGWYGYEWDPVEIPPPGSYFSFIDVDTNNSADSVAINFGKTAEDPQSLALGNQSLLSALAETSATAELLPQKEAKDTGQWGLGLSFYFPDLFTGTEFNLYYANYHSRLPFLSAFAGNIGCLDTTVPSGNATTDTANVLNDCPTAATNAAAWAIATGGDPSVDPAPEQNTGRQDNPETYSQPGVGGTGYPLDTVKFQLEYPEDIQLMGFSFNTAIGDIAFQGEFAYRPNDPLQVSVVDLGFSALQTVFPSGCAADPQACIDGFNAANPTAPGEPTFCEANPNACVPGGSLDFLDVRSGTGVNIPGLGMLPGDGSLTTVTGQEFVGPSYLLDYRGINSYSNDNPDRGPLVNGLRPGDYIQGFEEFQTINWILGATYVIGPDNPLFADQIILLFELGGTHILDLPPIEQLQIEAPGQVTHASAGADGSGADGNVNGLARSGRPGPSGARFNPQQANPEFWTTSDAFGYDIIALIRYESVFPGISFEPRILIKHDLYGNSPGPGERFVQGRQLYTVDVEMRVKNALSFSAGYGWFTGAEANNVLRDRDYAQFGARYRF